MAFILDHIEWHITWIAFGFLLYALWPWIRRPNWPKTPDFHVRYGWAILAIALAAALGWVFLFSLAARNGWM